MSKTRETTTGARHSQPAPSRDNQGMPSSQVTPPLFRVWTFGLLATAAAATLNYGWWWVCINAFHWSISVPSNFNQNVVIDASAARVFLTTVVVGIVATLGATFLAKVFIGPRWWWASFSTAVGAVSIYGAATIPDLDTLLKTRLGIFHVLTMIVFVPAMFRALHVGVGDLENAYRVHAQTTPTSVSQPTEEFVFDPEMPNTPAQASDYNINDTLIIPPRDDSEFQS